MIRKNRNMNPENSLAYVDKLTNDFRKNRNRNQIINQINQDILGSNSKYILIKTYFFSVLLNENSDLFSDYLNIFNESCMKAYEESIREMNSLINPNNIIDKIIESYPDIEHYEKEIDWYKKNSISPFVEIVFLDFIKDNRDKINKSELSDFLELMSLSESSLIKMFAKELYNDFQNFGIL